MKAIGWRKASRRAVLRGVGVALTLPWLESLVSREEMARADDLGRYYRIPADARDLNYKQYFVEGEVEISVLDDYTSHNTERLVARLDALAQENGLGVYAALLLILTQLTFGEEEAREHWEGILEQRHGLSLALGRDAGLRVATLDYFMNVNRRLVHPTLIDVSLESGAPSGGGDPLTGLTGDRGFRAGVQGELRRARRYGHPVSVGYYCPDCGKGVRGADVSVKRGRTHASR